MGGRGRPKRRGLVTIGRGDLLIRVEGATEGGIATRVRLASV